mmetsp:Transcript_16024/g.52450  ORF Transcript_16024/g.52450 Transcript_16024/m.52450 type:complete len:184 (+) Transcript_16024:3-554(+)
MERSTAEASSSTRLEFDGMPGRTLHLMLFTGVRNAGSLHAQLVAGKLEPELALLNAAAIPGLLPVHTAAYKALEAAERNKLVTRTLHSELVFGLSGSKHITESLKRFGIGEETSAIIVARFDATEAHLSAAKALVEGDLASLDELVTICDTALLQKYYKPTKEELALGSLEDVAAMRIAVRDC